VLTENKLGSFAPMGCMFPAVLDKARRMAVNLGAALTLVIHASFPSRFARINGNGGATLHGAINGRVGPLVSRHAETIGLGVV